MWDNEPKVPDGTFAVVGSRRGADLDHVRSFLAELYSVQPDWILVSGGAIGVDRTAEDTWLELGGRVTSFRPKRLEDYEGQPQYGVERWELGSGGASITLLDHPTFTDDPEVSGYVSALHYRNMLIAEYAQKVIAFYRRGRSRGTASTVEFAHNEGHLVWEYEA